MVPIKKNVETAMKEIEPKKRTTRKNTKKIDENATASPTEPAESEFVNTPEKSATKTKASSQANPGRFTAEMLIAMGQELEEEERKEKDEDEFVSCDAESAEEFLDCQEIEEAVEAAKETSATDDETRSEKRVTDIAGKTFSYRGMSFVALEESDGGVLAISADVLEKKMRFSDSSEKYANDWKKSSLRKKLNGEYLQNFNRADLLPIVSDLTADTGEDDYGKCEDYIAIPSDNMFRKFHKIIPAYPGWVWSLTPWAVNYGNLSAVGARTSAKTIYSEQVNRELGVVVVCKFKRDVVVLNN